MDGVRLILFRFTYFNLIKVMEQIESPGYIDVGDGCWRRNVLVTTLKCWWRFWPFSSPTPSLNISIGHQHPHNVISIEIRLPTSKSYRQHKFTNVYLSLTSILAQLVAFWLQNRLHFLWFILYFKKSHCWAKVLTQNWVGTNGKSSYSSRKVKFESYQVEMTLYSCSFVSIGIIHDKNSTRYNLDDTGCICIKIVYK